MICPFFFSQFPLTCRCFGAFFLSISLDFHENHHVPLPFPSLQFSTIDLSRAQQHNPRSFHPLAGSPDQYEHERPKGKERDKKRTSSLCAIVECSLIDYARALSPSRPLFS